MVTALVAVWAAVLLAERGRDVGTGLGWTVPLFFRIPPVSLFALAGRVLDLMKTTGVAAGFIVLFALAGPGLLRFIGIPSGAGVLYRCLAFPLGFGAVSVLLLGLLLCGLWFPSVMFSAVLILVLASRPLRSWRGLVPRRSPVPGMPGAMLVAVVFSLALFLPWMLAPETHPDGWTYHLAGPERWLAAHGLSLRQAAAPLYYPFLGELPSAFALVMGEDSAPKFWFGMWLLCGIRAFMESVDEGNRGWGLLGGLAGVSVVFTFCYGKIEGVGTGAALLAYACLIRESGPLRPSRWTAAAGAAIGLLFSYKYLGFFNALWIPVVVILFRGTRGAGWLVSAGIVSALVCLPWYARNYLAVGDPFFPQLVIRFPRFFDGFDSRAAVTAARWVPWYLEPMSFMRFLTLMTRENPFFVLVFPLAFVAGGFRLAMLAAVPLGFAVVLAHLFNSPQTERWFMPSILPSMLVSSAAAGKWAASRTGKSRKLAVAGLALVMLLSVLNRFIRQFGAEGPMPYLTGAESREAVRRAERSALVDLAACYNGLPHSGTLMVGDFAEYHLPKPFRVNYQAESGEAPFLWKVVGSSQDEGDILKRFRQAGVGYVAYNPVRSENNCGKYMAYQWSDRMISLYRGFWARHAGQVGRTPQLDQRNGIFYLYSIKTRGTGRADAYINHLPGTEDLMAQPLHKRFRTQEYAKSVEEFEALCRKWPGIGLFSCQLAHGYLRIGDYRKAYEIFRYVLERGLVNDTAVPTFGMVALSLEKYQEAIDTFHRSLKIEPDRTEEIIERLVLAHVLYGLDALGRGQVGRAGELFRAGISEGGKKPPARAERAVGFLHAMLGVVETRQGKPVEGRAEMEIAERFLPGISRQSPEQMQAIIDGIRSSLLAQTRGILDGSFQR